MAHEAVPLVPWEHRRSNWTSGQGGGCPWDSGVACLPDCADVTRDARGRSMPEQQEHEVVMTQFVIYERPADFPNHWVVLGWDIVRGRLEPIAHGDVTLTDSLDAARAAVPPGLHRLGPSAGDEQSIVEVWV